MLVPRASRLLVKSVAALARWLSSDLWQLLDYREQFHGKLSGCGRSIDHHHSSIIARRELGAR